MYMRDAVIGADWELADGDCMVSAIRFQPPYQNLVARASNHFPGQAAGSGEGGGSDEDALVVASALGIVGELHSQQRHGDEALLRGPNAGPHGVAEKFAAVVAIHRNLPVLMRCLPSTQRRGGCGGLNREAQALRGRNPRHRQHEQRYRAGGGGRLPAAPSTMPAAT